MPTLLEFFYHDFNGPSVDKTIVFSRETIENRATKNLGEIIEIRLRLLQDPDSLVKVFTFYIPASTTPLLVCKSLIYELEKLKWESQDREFLPPSSEEHLKCWHDSVYSKKIFIYSELPLSEAESTELDQLCHSMDWVLTLRSSNYMQCKIKSIRPMAFICHDQGDKESIAKPIARGLHSRFCYAGYEHFSLHPGIRLAPSVERGLQDGLHCILVISPGFLLNQAHAKIEFNSVFTKERIYNNRKVLPIWYGVTQEEVRDYSPLICDAFALTWPQREGKGEEEYQQEIEILISRLHVQIASMDGFHRFH
jgi:hypothetical protein